MGELFPPLGHNSSDGGRVTPSARAYFLKRAAQRCNIPNLISLTVAETYDRLKECKKECVFFQEHRKQYQRKHLNNRLQVAQESKDKETIQKISAIIQREQQRNFWHHLNYCTEKKKTQSGTTIQAEETGGAIVEHTTWEPVKQTIFSEIHNKRYTIAREAPYALANCLRS